jgi:hypothetical protein
MRGLGRTTVATAAAITLWPAHGGDASRPTLTETYAAAAARILDAEAASGQAFERLRHLTDRIGPRFSGTPGAEAAVRWTRERLADDGLEARTEPVLVPRWVRGEARADIVAPIERSMVVLALGGSEATPPGDVEAEVVAVESFDELRSLGEEWVRGRIVLFDRAMVPSSTAEAYGAAAVQRTRGAIEAARLGAVAALVRSVGTLAARLPHTGAMRYEDGVPRIPAAAVASEDADLIGRLLASGDAVKVRLRLGCRTLPDVLSANVVADLRGRELPEEIVLIGAHLDSWDVGQGAIDDGAGCAIVMESLRLLRSLGLVPRRTIRGVLFMNEENGLRGARAYAESHAHELGRHVAAIESDLGGARPLGFTALTGAGGEDRLREITALLRGLGADAVTPGGQGGADLTPLRPARVPLLGLRQDAIRYFDWHHTEADTLDKVDPRELAQNAAAMAVVAYVLADMPETLPRPDPQPQPVGRR